MCEKSDTIKFCSCSKHIDLNKTSTDSNYIWILDRVVGLDRSGLIGMTLLPTDQLDDLKPEWVVEKLNSENLFDFEYEPKVNDRLRIERINRSQAKQREYLFGEFLDFHYFNGQWFVGGVIPFMYDLENYKKGKVRLSKQHVQSLTDTYVKYELGDISPENLPLIAADLLKSFDNISLVELAGLNNPTKEEIDKLLLQAFEIPEERQINPYEKIELLIRRYELSKVIDKNIFYKLDQIKDELPKKWFVLEKLIDYGLGENWIPGDEWDYILEVLNKEIRERLIKNNYSDFMN